MPNSEVNRCQIRTQGPKQPRKIRLSSRDLPRGHPSSLTSVDLKKTISRCHQVRSVTIGSNSPKMFGFQSIQWRKDTKTVDFAKNRSEAVPHMTS